ncbi:MAG: hypothetical protein AB7P49_00720 [Bdellovibrionales bacterium]
MNTEQNEPRKEEGPCCTETKNGNFYGLDETSSEILRAANIVLPTPVDEIKTEEFRQLIDAVVWDGRAWTDPATHVYALGRDGRTKLPRKSARMNFRNRRMQTSVLLMKTFRDQKIHETTIRLKNGCEDPRCVNPFHFNLNATRMARRKNTMKERARPGSFTERMMNTRSWDTIECDYTCEFSAGDETSSLRSSPSSCQFSSMESEFADDEEESYYR